MNTEYLSKIRSEDCALLIIDCQKDFLLPEFAFESRRDPALIPNIVSAREWARSRSIPVVYTQEIHRRQKIDFGMEILRGDPEHCIEGSEGFEIIPELTPDYGNEFVIRKPRYSGFYQTDMELLLRALGKDTLILTGVDTNVCVYSTALDAQFRNFRVIALSDCTEGTSPELTKAFLENIDYILGDVITLDELKRLF